MLRDRLAARLPDMLDAAISAYQRIATHDGGEDPKRFAAAQSGAKAALAHIEQLIALAEVVIRDAPASRAEEAAAAERLVAEARAALASGPEEDAEDDADAPGDVDTSNKAEAER
ncbi:MAG: hypothetical protein NXI21_17310 [Alphaproteobacteria bacterium]|nr:hypothetical protein [Alphaproteobacteria bacterium]